MNKKTIRIAGWALGISMAVAGVGMAVGATSISSKEPLVTKADAGDSILTFSSATVVTSSSYGACETDDWTLNAGRNNTSAGWNKTAANAKQVTSTYAIDATNVTATTYGWVAATKSAQANIGSLTFTYTGNRETAAGSFGLDTPQTGVRPIPS